MKRSSKLLLAMLVLAMTSLGACGAAAPASPSGSRSSASTAPARSSSASSSGGASRSPSASAQASTTSINVAMAGFNLIESVASLAKQDGNYQRHGLNATVQRLNGSTVAMSALQSGEVPFVLTTGEAVLLAQTKGLPLIAIAALNRGFTASLVMANRYLDKHPLPSDADFAKRAALLQGAKVGWVSSSDEIMTKYLLQAAHLPASATGFVKMQNQEAQLAAMQQGQIDGIVLSPPQSFEAEAGGYGRTVVAMREIPGWDNIPYIVAVSTRTYVQQHPETTRAFLAALEEAVAKIATRSPEVLAYEGTVYPNSSKPVLERTLNFIEMSPYVPMQAAHWQSLDQILLFGAEITQPYNSKEGVDWTNEFLPPRPS